MNRNKTRMPAGFGASYALRGEAYVHASGLLREMIEGQGVASGACCVGWVEAGQRAEVVYSPYCDFSTYHMVLDVPKEGFAKLPTLGRSAHIELPISASKKETIHTGGEFTTFEFTALEAAMGPIEEVSRRRREAVLTSSAWDEVEE